MNYICLCVFFCSENNLHITTVVMHLSEGKGEAAVGV